MSLPIEYDVIVLLEGNQKHEFSLDEPGWLMKPEVRQAKVFTLVPRTEDDDKARLVNEFRTALIAYTAIDQRVAAVNWYISIWNSLRRFFPRLRPQLAHGDEPSPENKARDALIEEAVAAYKDSLFRLPLVSVDLSTPSGGTPWELVYFSRVFGNMALASTPLFRIYALGRKANVGGRAVRQMQYVYPSGAVLLAEEPLFVDELINKYLQAHYEATVADLHEGETIEEAAVRRYNLR